MEYDIKISDSKKYLIVKFQVNVTAELSGKSSVEAENLGKEHNINRMLFDVRNVRNIDSAKPNFDFVFSTLPKPEEHWFKKVASLADPHDISHSFAAAFLLSRGFNIKEFFKETEAHTWLEQD